MWNIVINIVEQGMIFVPVLAAVHLTSRVLLSDDLTIEGSFGIGGAVCAWLLLAGFPASMALGGALCAGACAGVVTGMLYSVLRVNSLVSGIIVMTGLYSLNLVCAGPYQSLTACGSVFDAVNGFNFLPMSLCLLVSIALIVVLLVRMFLQTEIGFLVRSVGANEHVLACLGKRADLFRILGLALANGLAGFAGGLFAQYLGFFSMSSHVGILIVAITGVMVGELIQVVWPVKIMIGACVYPVIVACIIAAQCDPLWNKAAIAGALIVLLAKKRWNKEVS